MGRKKGLPKTGGRKAHAPPLTRRCLRLTDDQIKLLRKWGRGDASAGLRWLIETAAHLIVRPDDVVV